MENRERLEGLHSKLWNMVDLIETLDIRLTVKELLMVTDRIAVVFDDVAKALYHQFLFIGIPKTTQHDYQPVRCRSWQRCPVRTDV